MSLLLFKEIKILFTFRILWSFLSASDQLLQIQHRILNTNWDDKRNQEWQYSYNNEYGNLKQKISSGLSHKEESNY